VRKDKATAKAAKSAKIGTDVVVVKREEPIAGRSSVPQSTIENIQRPTGL
jgi:hypothetical protein